MHRDCAGAGIDAREIRPPLTELSPVPAAMPAYERPVLEELPGGKLLGRMLLNRTPVLDIHHQSIARDQFLAMNKLAFGGPTYWPLAPQHRHASLVRPFWILNDVLGMDSGIWYYHPPNDRWTLLSRGLYRLEATYISGEQTSAANAAALGFFLVNVNHLLLHAGPDSYRLAHLEAGIVAHRFDLLASALDLAAMYNVDFYDEEARKLFGIEQTGWEILYEIMIGVPGEAQAPHQQDISPDESGEADGAEWRG
jgi:SagB-type dehydrogenase family enzyme